jgi:hypothetical protein
VKKSLIIPKLAMIPLGVLLVTACTSGIIPVQSPSQTSTPASQAQTPTAFPSPEDIVTQFLNSLSKDASGKSSLGYLSLILQEDIAADHSLMDLMSIQNMYRSFGISNSFVEDSGKRAFVQVGLNYGSPILREFVLIQQDGGWRINNFIDYDIPSPDIYPYYQDANTTILDYIQALHEDKPAVAWNMLQADTQLVITQTELETQANAVLNINVSALDLIKDDGDRLVYHASIWVDPNTDLKSEWAEGRNERWFELVNTLDGWRIQQVSMTSID